MGYMAARAAFVTHQSQECMGVLTDTTQVQIVGKFSITFWQSKWILLKAMTPWYKGSEKEYYSSEGVALSVWLRSLPASKIVDHFVLLEDDLSQID